MMVANEKKDTELEELWGDNELLAKVQDSGVLPLRRGLRPKLHQRPLRSRNLVWLPLPILGSVAALLFFTMLPESQRAPGVPDPALVHFFSETLEGVTEEQELLTGDILLWEELI